MGDTLGLGWLRLRRSLRGRWLIVPLGLLLAYFGWHAVHGDRGIYAWLDLSREIEAERAELADLRAQRETLDRRVQGLQPNAIDPDLLEEELRKLGYVKDGEVIVLRPQPAPAPTKP